jgi:hypothetical protein
MIIMNASENRLMENVWQYPLFQALAQRRAHRFALGCDLRNTPFPYKSEKKPVPLNEMETALLCWAGHGINGLALGDIDVSLNTFMSWNGRTHPAPCNCQDADLFFINDEGVFLYRPSDATEIVEIETPEQREKILTAFRKDTVKIADGRPDLPPESMLELNFWNANKPGQTLFMPVVNVTHEYLTFLFIALNDGRQQLIDDRTGKPAGVGKWIDNGFLNGPQLPMTLADLFVLNVMTATGHYMAHNINLACAAMGLGGFVWSGFTPLLVMGGTPFTRGLGFRFITGKDGMPTPVGKDGYIEALCPPYFKNMDAVVDHVLNMKFGPGGLFSPDYQGKVAWRDASIPTKAAMYTDEGVACTKAYLNYVYETYGRFPAVVDAIQMPVAATAHHLDLDFYDKYYPPAVIRKEQRNHMKVWHNGE